VTDERALIGVRDRFQAAQRALGGGVGRAQPATRPGIGGPEQAPGRGDLGVVEEVMGALEPKELRRDQVRGDARLVDPVLLQDKAGDAAADQRDEHERQPKEHPAVEGAT
jgi:hypothetical protein